MTLDSKIPPGPIDKKWEHAKAHYKLVNPANKRKYDVIVVGAGLAGAAAAASMAELGYNVQCFVYHDSPRRAHSIAAQGGINAAKNYQNDGDSIYRLFYDTVKGGDYRSREANVYRLAQLSVNIIDQASRRACRSRANTAACSRIAPSAACRSRAPSTRAARPASSFSSARSRRWSARSRLGRVKMFPRHEMLDVVVVDGQAKGIVTRNLVTGTITSYAARRRRPRPPAATRTSSIFRRTPKPRTPPPSGARIAAARTSRIPATRRSIRPASRRAATSSRS